MCATNRDERIMKLIWIISKQFRVTKVNIGQGGRDLYLSIFLETRRVLLPPHHLQSDQGRCGGQRRRVLSEASGVPKYPFPPAVGSVGN